jgi:murein DD-endopeptidase MepM/ murein hydrolase activator NlpD
VPTSQRSGAEAPEDILAEQVDPEAHDPERVAAPTPARRSMRQSARATSARMKTTVSRAPRADRAPRSRGAAKPLRSVVILAMVGGLVATVALPAYAAWNPESSSEAVTIEQVAADNAQSLVVASDVATTDLSRSSYAATTAEEVATKKAAEAAAARAATVKKVVSSGGGASLSSVDLSLVAPGSGTVRWPLDMSQIRIGRGISSVHDGVDLLGAAGTPEFAAAAGTVRTASWFGGYGNGVIIDHVINGVTVSTLYGHMSQILVSPGQTVSAGQIIGLMGSTGNSTANHLHFEVRINGGLVDPMAWLQSNAG